MSNYENEVNRSESKADRLAENAYVRVWSRLGIIGFSIVGPIFLAVLAWQASQVFDELGNIRVSQADIRTDITEIGTTLATGIGPQVIRNTQQIDQIEVRLRFIEQNRFTHLEAESLERRWEVNLENIRTELDRLENRYEQSN